MSFPSWSGKVSWYHHKKDNIPKVYSFESLEELYTYLTPYSDDVTCTLTDCVGKDCSNKDGMAWSPGVIEIEGLTRAGTNTAELHVVGIDLDQDTKGFPKLTEDILKEIWTRTEGVERFVHSTHSYPKKCSYRLVFPLSRPITRKEWDSLRAAVVRKFELPADPKPKNQASLFFLPRVPQGAPSHHARGPGELLDVDKMLVEHFNARKEPQAPSMRTREEGTTDLKSLRSYLERYEPEDDPDGEKTEMIRRVLAGEPLADKPGGTTVKSGGVEISGRDDAVFRTATIIGWLMPTNAELDAVVALMRASIGGIPEYSDDGKNENFDGWMAKARGTYEKAHEKKCVEIEARSKLSAIAKRVKQKDQQETKDSDSDPTSEGSNSGGGDGIPPSPPPEFDPDQWVREIKTKVNKDGSISITGLTSNAGTILEKHPDWHKVLRFNEVTIDIECVGGPINDIDKKAGLHTATEYWLQRKLDLDLKSSQVEAALLYAARQNTYNPIKDKLNPLVWDRVPRMDTWLETYCGAQVTDDGYDITSYIRNVGPKWLISAVARALDPGCQADDVLILEGKQGIGKTSALRILGGKWYSKAEGKLTDKDTKMLVNTSWIVEMAELSSMNNTESEAQKAFFSERVDRFRPPYGKRMEEFPRHCVYAGTTNEPTYLRDETGNRRYKPVVCEWFDLPALTRDRDQIWAEAVFRFKAGESWHFDKKSTEEAENITNRRLRGGNLADAIWSCWAEMDPTRRPKLFTIADVVIGWLKVPAQYVEEKSVHVGRAMKRLGFVKVRVQNEGIRQWMFEPTREQLNVPREIVGHKSKLRLIAGAKVPDPPDEVEHEIPPNVEEGHKP